MNNLKLIENVKDNEKQLAKLAATYARELALADHAFVDKSWSKWKDEDPICIRQLSLDEIKIAIVYGVAFFKVSIEELQDFLDSENKQNFVQKAVNKSKKYEIECQIFKLEKFLESNNEDDCIKSKIKSLRALIDKFD